jgi:hypothetical protein
LAGFGELSGGIVNLKAEFKVNLVKFRAANGLSPSEGFIEQGAK